MKLLLCAVLLGMGVSVMAQHAAGMTEKASKEAKKEAKRLKKEKWQILPGALPLERQVDKSYQIQYETDMHFQPKYVMGRAQSVGEFYDAAKLTAEALAKQDMASKISSEFTGLIEAQLKNEQHSPEMATSVSQVAAEAKSIFEQHLGRITPVMELTRTKKNGNVEVLIVLAYDMGKGLAAGKEYVDSKCKEKGIPFVTTLVQ